MKGQPHRENGLPAVEYLSGTKMWYVNGRKHRDNGLPAIEYWNGEKEWWVNGHRHRDNDLPAIEYANRRKEWYVNGQRHREGGLSAFYCIDGYKGWRIYGKILSEEKGLAYFAFCQKIKEKKRIRAQKKIYCWWIPICYDLSRPCGQRMAQKNLISFEKMMG